ncbi:hypothetical protein NX80_014985 [Xanthomonas vasicola pv. arecae]|nr:hypothetical protein NX80_014985 [Xanthomonas vasicola pv. arecae]
MALQKGQRLREVGQFEVAEVGQIKSAGDRRARRTYWKAMPMRCSRWLMAMPMARRMALLCRPLRRLRGTLPRRRRDYVHCVPHAARSGSLGLATALRVNLAMSCLTCGGETFAFISAAEMTRQPAR